MKIYVLFGQRKQRYAGEYGPEALEALDEYGYDENPLVWLAEQRTKHEESDDFESMAVIAVEVVDAEITKRLNPEMDTIAGKVVDD